MKRKLIFSFVIFCIEHSFSQMVVGSYTGNGVDNRNITGLGPGTPSVVIIKGNTGQQAVIRTNTMTGDASKEMVNPIALNSNYIQSFFPGGFQIGSHAAVNNNGTTYYYIAFGNMAGYIATGSYTGNGAGQSISGVGFTPGYVIVIPANSTLCYQRSASMSGAYDFGSTNAAGATIASLDADGFSVGLLLSSSGVTYHYVAFKKTCPGEPSAGFEMEENFYTGNGTACSYLINTCSPPEWLIIRGGTNCGPNCSGAEVCGSCHRTSLITGSCPLSYNTHFFTAASNSPINIASLSTSNIAVSGNQPINCPDETYYWIAFNGSNELLPVQLVSFSGYYENGNVFLKWKTASEQNNDYFTIERSFNTQFWTMAGKVKGIGNSSVSHEYEFTDAELPTSVATVYYRLKQTDFDGKFEYFSPISINLSGEKEKILSVFPNPVSIKESLNLMFELPDAEKDADVKITIYNVLGEKIHSQIFEYSGGKQLNQIELQQKKFEKGVYFIRVEFGADIFGVKKFIIVD